MRARSQPHADDLSRRSLLAGAVSILVLPLSAGLAAAAPEDMVG